MLPTLKTSLNKICIVLLVFKANVNAPILKPVQQEVLEVSILLYTDADLPSRISMLLETILIFQALESINV